MLLVKNIKFQRGGALLLIASMFSSLLFGVFYHMLAFGSNNIFTVMHGEWSVAFQSTAILLAIVDGVGCWVGLRVPKVKRLRSSNYNSTMCITGAPTGHRKNT